MNLFKEFKILLENPLFIYEVILFNPALVSSLMLNIGRLTCYHAHTPGSIHQCVNPRKKNMA